MTEFFEYIDSLHGGELLAVVVILIAFVAFGILSVYHLIKKEE